MQQNLGSADRYMRLITGIISLTTAAKRRRQSPLTRTFLLSFGAMKVAEGVIGWCPMRYVAEQMDQQQSSSSQQQPPGRQSQNSQPSDGDQPSEPSHENAHSTAQ